MNPMTAAQITEFCTLVGLKDPFHFSIAELYPGVLPDPPSTSRTGFFANSEERCHTLTLQGTQYRRRSTIPDTTKFRGQRSSLERAEDRLCKQHKTRAPELAVTAPADVDLCSCLLIYLS